MTTRDDTSTFQNRLFAAYEGVRDDLLAARNDAGYWEGELASSALSTATAISALAMDQRRGDALVQPEVADGLMRAGIEWLLPQQNQDGGWGDTDQSYSNISTTMLVEAALSLAGVAEQHRAQVQAARDYVSRQGGVAGLRARYGKDKTFAVPILTNCALAGLVDWSQVASLPFELACLPQSFYRFVRLPVVSYAIPALVAVGQVGFVHRKSWNPLLNLVRRRAVNPSLAVLERMMPASGGFLEAIPLTSFVVMSLIGAGQQAHSVVRRGLQFLVATARPDGSWPIDSNLATWNTALAVYALGQAGDESHVTCWDWLRSCQNVQRHPFTGADPGGWGWSDLSGAVPDADDTPATLLALGYLYRTVSPAEQARILAQVEQGAIWLLGLQNRDGGWPTFCRGWGALPFDRSGADLTAHAIRALHFWRDQLTVNVQRPIEAGLAYLAAQQRQDGSWYPLWFGNQDHPEEENPVYGTAKVLLAYRDLDQLTRPEAQRGLAWLRTVQRPDGGWNAGAGLCQGVETAESNALSIVEETALAVEALVADNTTASQDSGQLGIEWLVRAVQRQKHLTPTPIGFYFAKLWYHEQLYPLVFTVSALGSAVRHNRHRETTVG